MLTRTTLTRLSLTLVALSIASGCAKHPAASFPPAADLIPPLKPIPTVEMLASENAAIAYDNAVEAWGEGLYRQVLRLCQWAQTMGDAIACPIPPEPGR